MNNFSSLLPLMVLISQTQYHEATVSNLLKHRNKVHKIHLTTNVEIKTKS